MGNVSFSFENILKFFDPLYITITIRSIYISLVATLLCLIIGYPIAYFMSQLSPSWEKILVILLVLPMWMNFLLRTYAWQSLLYKDGLINNIINLLGFETVNLLFNSGTVLLGMVYNFLPFMVLPIYTVLKKIDIKLIEAAEDLGANKKTVFYKVIMPLTIPGIVSGVTMVFMPAVSTFVISALLGGGKYSLIGNMIEQQFTVLGNWNFGSALSIVLLLIIASTQYIMNKIEKKGAVN
jgi:spermidine/putrescine transport system permease protein